MNSSAASGVLPGLVCWVVRRVDLSGRCLFEASGFSGECARAAFQRECLRLGIGDGAAVYLLADGRTVDQVVARALEPGESEEI